MWSSTETAFAFHLFIELPAAWLFFFRPSQTLEMPQPHAHAVIRQYALLLMSTNIIATAAFFQRSEEMTKTIAGALVLYHVGPIIRAVNRGTRSLPNRITNKKPNTVRETTGTRLGNPWPHAILHTVCLVLLLNVCLGVIHW